VTVTTKATNYIFILHSEGMTNLKLAELPLEVREELGYAPPSKPKTVATAASDWAQNTVTKLESPQVKVIEQHIKEKWQAKMPNGIYSLKSVGYSWLIGIAVCLLLCHLFFSYCRMLICQKSGSTAGPLVWFPVLNFIPLLKAAAMNRWWFLAWFVPILNIVMAVMWAFKIVKVRGKHEVVAVFLILPIINIFAFLYLAFSDGRPKETRIVEIMTLEAA
jgi:hypothetical protein